MVTPGLVSDRKVFSAFEVKQLVRTVKNAGKILMIITETITDSVMFIGIEEFEGSPFW